MSVQKFIIISILLYLSGSLSYAQELPPCREREFLVDFPRISPLIWCIELPLPAASASEQRHTSMVVASDGTLYTTNPYQGEIIAIRDGDGDGLPDTQTVIADALRYPNGLSLYHETLYVLGDGIIYTINNGIVEILIDDLPNGQGFLARGIHVYEDLLYVAIPYSCDFCEADDPLRGTVLQMRLDGTERRVIARGLRYPAGLAIYQDVLWVTDIARDAFDGYAFLDELNQIDLDNENIPHFGFPYCVGRDNLPDLEADFDCATASSPIVTLYTHSTPIALAHYHSETVPGLTDSLLVVLMGSNNSSFIAGHAVFALNSTEGNYTFDTIVPVDHSATSIPSRWQQSDAYNLIFRNAEFVNNQGGGIFPHYFYDVAVSPEGWLYLSVQGKGIYVLRPR